MLSEYSYYLLKKRFYNFKPMMKFYIDKSLYDLFDYAVYYQNSHCIEFYTLNNNYKEIWSKLRISEDYGYTRLMCMEWDDVYGCYCVDVFCFDFIQFLMSWNKHHWSSVGENVWKNHARSRGWCDEVELEEGWLEYKKRVDDWFFCNYG